MADPDQRAARRGAVTAARRSPAPPPVPVVPAAAPVQDPMLQFLAQQAQFMQQFQAPQPLPQQQMPYQQMPLVSPDLDPTEVAYFDSLANRLNSTYDQSASNNQLQQTQLQTEHGVRLEDLTRRYDQMRERLPGQFQNRGLMNSGVYQAGLGDYATNRTNAFADINRAFGNQMTGLQQQYAQLGQTKTAGLADIDSQRAAKKHAKASIVRAVR